MVVVVPEVVVIVQVVQIGELGQRTQLPALFTVYPDTQALQPPPAATVEQSGLGVGQMHDKLLGLSIQGELHP